MLMRLQKESEEIVLQVGSESNPKIVHDMHCHNMVPLVLLSSLNTAVPKPYQKAGGLNWNPLCLSEKIRRKNKTHRNMHAGARFA